MEPRKKFSRAQRIRRPTTFKRLAEEGTFARGEFFFLWSCVPERTTVKDRPALGVVVTRSAAARAVERNVWKRRIREIFRAHQDRLRGGTACLIKARPVRQRPSFGAMEKELIALFKKTGAWA